MATWIWTLCYAIDMKLLLGDKNGRPAYYHAFAWVLPAILTSFGLIILYIPDAESVFTNIKLFPCIWPKNDDNKREIVLQLSQPDIVIQCNIAHPSKLLRYICAAGSGHDRESNFVRSINSRPRDGGSA